MDIFRVHDPYEESNHSQLEETKGKYRKWKPQDCIKDGILLLTNLESVEMSAVVVFDGEDGDADATPLAYLRLHVNRRGIGL